MSSPLPTIHGLLRALRRGPTCPPVVSTPLLALLLLASCTEYGLTGRRGAVADTSAPSPDTSQPPDTGTPRDCGDFSAGAPYQVGLDEGCEREVEPGGFDPLVEWQWSSNTIHPGYEHVMATPAVANLTDDDGDGDIDADDVPDIVFTAFSGSAYDDPGELVMISGDGGGMHWSIPSAGGYPFYSSSGVAVGDLDGDGTPEICASGTTAAVVCVEPDASLFWAADGSRSSVGCPSIADLDGDGQAELIFGSQVFDSHGRKIAEGAYGTGGIAFMSFAVDMDGDGQLEVVAGNTVYEADGSVLWRNAEVPDGPPAAGDFDGDGEPEVVVVANGSVYLLDTDGTTTWSTEIPGGGRGGAPTVADFDGDGQPEVGVAGLGAYTVFETDGSVRWSRTTEDDSSSATGSSVFDFEGDGAAEVVYADEHNLWVYDGDTGAVRVDFSDHASGTLWEYPVIADVDHDGSTEIVVASNDYAWAGWQGITVVGDAGGSWSASRPVWNQFAYFITNVEDDASIPAVQQRNWLTWNDFRAGGTLLGPSHWLPDLAPDMADSCSAECRDGRVYLAFSVYDDGLLDAAPFTVGLYQDLGGTEKLVHREEVPGLASGSGTWLGPIALEHADWGDIGLTVRADDGDALEECDESNNALDLGPWPCSR